MGPMLKGVKRGKELRMISSNWGLLILQSIGGGTLVAALIYVTALRHRRDRH
jgi:hypothetical protein